MRATLLIMLLLTLCLPAAGADDTLSTEQALPAHGETDAYDPAAAFGGGVYLVVWEADRNRNADLVAMRLDASGKPLDEKPFVVSDAKDQQCRPRIAYGPALDGKGDGVFLVVWHDLRNGEDYDTYAARVTPEGKVLDKGGVRVAGGENNQCQPDVCWDGANFQIVWRAYEFRKGDAYDIWGRRISLDGGFVDGEGTMLIKRGRRFAHSYAHPPGVGSNGKGDVVVATYVGQHSSYHTVRDGKPVGKSIKKGRNWDPVFATDGEELLVCFTSTRPMGRGGTAKKPTGGFILDPRTLETGGNIALSSSEDWRKAGVRNCSPAWDGRNYVVAWDENPGGFDRVLLRLISPDGKPLDKQVHVAGRKGAPAHQPAVASEGKGTALIFYERHPENADQLIRIAVRILRRGRT